MRTLAIATATITLSCLPLAGCSSSETTTRGAEPELAQGKTSGGVSTPVGQSRVAAPLAEAGERGNYPEDFDVGRTRPVEPHAETAAAGQGQCLAELGDLRIEVTDVYDGAAIIVTSRTGDASEIFDRASVLAQAHGAHGSSSAEDGESATAKPGEQPAASLDMPATEVRVIELAHGARIHYLARDTENDVIELRNAVRRIASDLEQGACPGL